MYATKFDTIKKKALREHFAGVQQRYATGRSDGTGSLMVLEFARMDEQQRRDLIDLADAFQPSRDDELGSLAKEHDPYAMMMLRAREEGARSIDRCDVRQVGVLIRQFPAVVPRRLREAPVTAYLADDPASTWMVEFAAPSRH